MLHCITIKRCRPGCAQDCVSSSLPAPQLKHVRVFRRPDHDAGSAVLLEVQYELRVRPVISVAAG